MALLSVIVPVFNEKDTIVKILEAVQSVDVDKEIIVVNDASTDGTKEVLSGIRYPNLKVISHAQNRGKGAAFITGLRCASGELVVIQDADLEYNPDDYPALIQPILDNRADLCLGVRFSKGYKGLLWHKLGNRLFTKVLNILYGCRLNDIYTCYKAARRKTFEGLVLKAKDFTIELEILIKALQNRLNIVEVPIRYMPRSYSEGKKIRLNDAFKMARSMIKLKFFGG